MSDSIDDGGPAFPSPHYNNDELSGMSLRDYFAGQIVAGLLANSSYEDYRPAPLAMSAYEVADAMIVARKVGAK